MDLLHDVLVVQRAQNTPYRWLADLTTDGVLVYTHRGHDLRERLEFLDSAASTASASSYLSSDRLKGDVPDDVEDICSAHGEVGAEVVVNLGAVLLDFGFEDVRHERDTCVRATR